MRSARARVAGVAVLASLASLLLSGCELREGDSREYGATGSDIRVEVSGDLAGNSDQ